MLLVQDLLCLDQFRVKLRERHLRRHHGMLNVKEAVIPSVELAGFREPTLGAGVWSIDADIDDLRDFQTPLPDDFESLPVPIRIGDEIDGDSDSHGSSEFERLE